MTETLEPRHVGPVAGGHLRASDADRNQVADVLDTAFTEGRLSRDEYDERLASLPRAKTFDDLVDLTRDLVVVASPTLSTATEPSHYAVEPSAGSGDVERMLGIFGGTERKGKWRISRQTETYALFGGIKLDLQEAVFESQVVEIRGFWCFGGMEIMVPEGVEVRDQTSGIFGGTDVKDLADPQPGAPVIVLKGLSLFGGVSVRGPKTSRSRGASAVSHRSHGCGSHRH